MANKVPTNILKLRGAEKGHGDRIKAREGEIEDNREVGGPPSYLSTAEKRTFSELKREIYPGLLSGSSRTALAALAKLVTRMKADAAADAVNAVELRQALGDFKGERENDDPALCQLLSAFVSFMTHSRPMTTAEFSQLRSMFGKFGLTPIDAVGLKPAGKGVGAKPKF